jgi:hypothetical protein
MIRTYSRAHVADQPLRNSGPYEAIIINHHDPLYMGSLEVELLKYTSSGNAPRRSGQLVTAKYLSPFYGATPVAGLSNNDAFHQTQKSYGMWMIPPDAGTRVLVIFAEGNSANAYWIGCIQDTNMNFMVPDGRAATELTTDSTPENLKDIKVPVGEYNKAGSIGPEIDATLYKKPYNKDFTEVLEIQGLLFDEARGLTTSSARRETPSAVFGINTPGPLDKRNRHPTVEYGPEETKVEIPFNRLGGSSFVMDDGDDKFIRATHASDGPPMYVNKEKGDDGGDETIPQNECIRIRTRTGHQILLHNSEDLIYITNSRGTAWIELTSDGKIDIHAEDSVSIHSEQDFNFRAERDVNIEAGRNINMRASASWSDDQPSLNGVTSGNIRLDSRYDVAMRSSRSTIFDAADELNLNFARGIRLTTDGNLNLVAENIITEARSSVSETAGQSWYRRAGSTMIDQAEGEYYAQIGGNMNLNSNGSIFETARQGLHMSGQSMFSSATQGYNVQAGSVFALDTADAQLNGGVSVPATQANTFIKAEPTNTTATAQTTFGNSAGFVGPVGFAGSNGFEGSVGFTGSNGFEGSSGYVGSGGYASTDAGPGDVNRPVSPVRSQSAEGAELHGLPRMRPGMTQPTIFDSIMKRVPQHEPWTHHENLDPRMFKPEMTDATIPTEYYSADRILTPDTFMKNIVGRTSSSFVNGSGGMSSSSVGGTAPSHLYGNTPSAAAAIPAGPMPPQVQGNRPASPSGANQFVQRADRDGPLATIRTRSGLSTRVASVFQGNFQGFINDLEATGYRITSLGGYFRRQSVRPGGGQSGVWSYHALGAAIDINPSTNGFFTRSRTGGRTITDMPSNVGQIAAQWGLGWGGNWRSTTDAMHFSAGRPEGGSFALDRRYGRVPWPVEYVDSNDRIRENVVEQFTQPAPPQSTTPQSTTPQTGSPATSQPSTISVNRLNAAQSNYVREFLRDNSDSDGQYLGDIILPTGERVITNRRESEGFVFTLGDVRG